MNRRKRMHMADNPGQTSPLDYAVTHRDSSTMKMVEDAIAHKQVMLAYQPVVSAYDHKAPAFYEGLIRVLDDTGRVIPAKDFMGAVSDTETGRMLDCLALELGLHTLVQQPDVRLSINMSARSIGFKRWINSLKRGLARREDIAERLILEISESSAMQVPEHVTDFMDDMQMQGVSFALDDYGAGATSFRFFKDFFFDIIKVDGQFTRNIAMDRENQILVGAMTAIAQQFDMYTVAGRVESPEDAEILKQLGFDCLQGFLFGAPTVSPPWKDNKAKGNRRRKSA